MQCDGLNLVELRYVDYPSTLLLRMNELRLAGQFCDVTVEVDGLQFRAHRSVLASASKLFENLFSQHQQPQPSKLFRLDFLSSKAFGLVLEFLYTASLKVEVEALESLRSAAHILQLGPLEQVCSLVLQQATTSPTDDMAFDGLSSSVNEMVVNVTVGAGNCGEGESAPRNACERTYGDVGTDELSATDSGLSTIERQLVSLSQASADGLCEETPACQLVGMLEQDAGGQDHDDHLENQNLAQVIVLPVDGFVEQQSAIAAVEALPEHGEGIERIEVEAEPEQPDVIEQEQPAAQEPRAHVPNQCFVCGMVVNSSAELGSHLWKEHLLFNEGECKMCGKVVSSKAAAQKHLLYHAGEMKLSCSTCGEGFAFKQDLLLHKRNAHGRGKPYMCDECGRVFFSNGNFLRHQRIVHKGLKPHVCTQCGRSFVDGGNLARHMKRHTGDLSYPCDKCDKVFSALCHLNDHSRTHNVGIKPYECKVCSRRCRSFASMRNHISRHGGDHQAFRCPVCTFGSPSSRKMQQHITERHKSDLSDAWNIEQTHMFIIHDM
uniref:zinc finger and BTB domain-containing protein 16-like n=1 Tax=Myxine glutinosa TaxID=7769 RepID=UPI00358F1EF8